MKDPKEMTLRTLEDVSVVSFMNENRCHLKRKEEPGFGFVTLQDALSGKMIVRFHESDDFLEYPDAEALVADGWILD